MNETSFVDSAPNGYKEHQTFTPTLTKAQLHALKEDRTAAINAQAAIDAKLSDHGTDGFKFYA
jgi:hypothetical protein